MIVIKILFDIIIITPVELLLFALKLIKKAIMIMLKALVVAVQLFVVVVFCLLCLFLIYCLARKTDSLS